MKKFNGYGFLVSLVYFVFSLATIVLTLRFVLKLFSADSSVPFVNWVYQTSQPLLYPFIGMFPAPIFEGGFVLEFTVLFTILIYELVKFIILQGIELINSSTKKED